MAMAYTDTSNQNENQTSENAAKPARWDRSHKNAAASATGDVERHARQLRDDRAISPRPGTPRSDLGRAGRRP